jgi:spore germination protein GerM
LVPVDREVTQAGVPNERLATLFNGATPNEIDSGITSGIPADTVLLDVTTDEEDREVMIDLSPDIFSIEGEALVQAFAQIVWTATEPTAGGYRQVRFSVDGEPTPVLDGAGAEQEGPVTRGSYDALRPVG